MSFTNLNRDEALNLLNMVIFPFLSSIITTLLFGYLIKYFINLESENKIKIEKINKNINYCNTLVIKSINRYNSLMRILIYLLPIKERLKDIIELKSIVTEWELNTAQKVEYSNTKRFHNTVKEQILKFCNNINLPILIFLKNIGIEYNNMEKFINDDKMFLLNIRKILILDEEDKHIFTCYSELFGKCDLYEMALQEYNLAINEFKVIIDDNQITINKVVDCLEGIIYKYFHLLELIILDLFILFDFLTRLINKFTDYYQLNLKKYSNLDAFIDPEMIRGRKEFLQYSNKTVIYNHYGFSIKDNFKRSI
jgi:hypothetical protein